MEIFTHYSLRDETIDLCKKIADNRINISTLEYLSHPHNTILYYTNYIIKTLFISLYDIYVSEKIHVYIFSHNNNIKIQYGNLLGLIKKIQLKGYSFYLNEDIDYQKKNIIIVLDDNKTNYTSNMIKKTYSLSYQTIQQKYIATNNHSNYIIIKNSNLYNKLTFIDTLYYINTIYKSIIYVNDFVSALFVYDFFIKLNYSCTILDKDKCFSIDSDMQNRIFIVYDTSILYIFSTQVNYCFYLDMPLFMDLYLWRMKYLLNHNVIITFLNRYNHSHMYVLEKYGLQFRSLII
jgi:hypothetical protein